MVFLYFLMIFLITPSIAVKGMPYNYGIYYYPKEMYMVLFTIVVATYLLYKHKRKELKIDKMYLYLFLSLFGIFTIGHTYSVTHFFSGRTIGGLFIFVISFIYFYNYKHKKLFIYILWLVAVLQGIVGITQKMGIYYDITGIIDMKDRLTFAGTMGNVNMVSHFMSAVFLISGYYIFMERKKWIKNILIIGNIFIFYMMLVAQTRGSLLALIIGITMLFIKYYKRILCKDKKTILKMGIGMVIAIAVFVNFELTDEALRNRLGEEEGINSTNHRLFIWRETAELIKEKPITGYGTGSFIVEERIVFEKLVKQEKYKEFKDFNMIAAHSHNDYFQTFAENGIFGFMIVIGIVVLTIIRFRQSKRYISGIFFAGILAYMITGFFEFPFRMIHNGVISFAILGIFLSTVKIKK